jgi:hypothetical protein
MAEAAKAAKPATDAGAGADPDKLVRQQAGTYRTGDERFEIREGDAGWFLVDSQQTNEFGQELIQGPFPTLKAVRAVLPEARAATLASRPAKAPKKGAAAPKAAKADKSAKSPAAPPPPPTWIERLPRAEASDVRKLIAALERAGVDDAEGLVRRDREGLLPAVATRLAERALEEIIDDLPTAERDAGRVLVRRAAEVLSGKGTARREPLPGWILVEIGAEPEPPNRRIDLRK